MQIFYNYSGVGINNLKTLEEICKLIFCLQKNSSYKEFLEFKSFLEFVFKLAKNLIRYFPYTINCLTYLFLFFGFFSKINLENISISDKKFFLKNFSDLVKMTLEKIFPEDKKFLYRKNSYSFNASNIKDLNANNSNIENECNPSNIPSNNLVNFSVDETFNNHNNSNYSLFNDNNNLNFEINFLENIYRENNGNNINIDDVEEEDLNDFFFAIGEMTYGM